MVCTELATFVAKVSLMGPFSPSTAGRCVHVEWECRQEAWVKLNIPRKTVSFSLEFGSTEHPEADLCGMGGAEPKH